MGERHYMLTFKYAIGTKGQTDGFTIANTVLSIASYADALQELFRPLTFTPFQFHARAKGRLGEQNVK